MLKGGSPNRSAQAYTMIQYDFAPHFTGIHAFLITVAAVTDCPVQRSLRAVAAATTATAMGPVPLLRPYGPRETSKNAIKISLVHVHVHEFSGRVLRAHMHGNNPGWREVCTMHAAQTRVVL